VGEFEALARGGIDDRVIADHIAAADGMDTDFVIGAFTDNAGAAVACRLGVIEFADLSEDLGEMTLLSPARKGLAWRTRQGAL